MLEYELREAAKHGDVSYHEFQGYPITEQAEMVAHRRISIRIDALSREKAEQEAKIKQKLQAARRR